jgi:hypothetical protein
MHPRAVIPLVFLGALCAVPLLQTVATGTAISPLNLLSLAAGLVLAFYPLYKTKQSDYSAVTLRTQSTEIRRAIEALRREVSTLQLRVGLLTVDGTLHEDRSAAGLAWKRINGSTDRRRYRDYIVEHPGSPYCDEAKRREHMLGAWNIVDKSDPFDIHYFLMRGPFHALDVAAQAALRESVVAAQTGQRRELWRQMAIPFYVLAPLFVLVYGVVAAVAMGLWVLSGLPTFTARIPPVLAMARQAVANGRQLWPEAAAAAEMTIDMHGEQIVRGVLAAAFAVGGGMLLTWILSFAHAELLQPAYDAIDKELDAVTLGMFDEVV